jgi:crotonobetainyl-CoA hydratase
VSDFEYLLYAQRDGLVTITINRPESLNALNMEASAELLAAFERFKADETAHVAILTGAGTRAFCAGNDLKATAAENAAGGRQARKIPWGGITSGFECFKPIIAAVNGYAMGGGFELALFADIVVASENARFALPEPRVGLIAGAGGVHRLPQQIGLKHAMGLLLTSRQISAAEAYQLGIVNEVVPQDQLLATAERWANEILQGSPLMVQLTKEAALSGLNLSVEDALALDNEGLMQRVYGSEDYVEGPKAFSEKRKPVWKGR